MEQEQKPIRGEGKEQQLNKIAAAVNIGSAVEANKSSTSAMIGTFAKLFNQNALEIIDNIEDNQKDLIKNMVNEITKLQTKNISEFEKAIAKVVALSEKLVETGNPAQQKLGEAVKGQAQEELLRAKGITLAGEKDTFLNRMGREVGIKTDKDPLTAKTGGIGKIAKGFLSEAKSGFMMGAGPEEGGFYDRVFRTDETKRQRELSRNEERVSNETNVSAEELFKKTIEEILNQKTEEANKSNETNKSTTTTKSSETDSNVSNENNVTSTVLEKLSDITEEQKKILQEKGIAPASENDISYRKDGKVLSKEEVFTALKERPTTSSESQEDAAGVSKDAKIEAFTRIAESSTILQENSGESLDIFKKMLEKMDYLAKWFEDNGSTLLSGFNAGGSGGGLLDTLGDAGDLIGNKGFKKLGGFARKAGGFLSKNVGKLGAVAAVGMGAYQGITGYNDAADQEEAQNADIENKVKSGEITPQQAKQLKEENKKSATVNKGKAVGSGAGTAIGAIAGGALGSLLGPVGTVAGGAAGAWLGEKAGGWLGEKAGGLINYFSGDDKTKATAEKPKEGVFSKIGNFAKDNKGALIGAALGPVGMAGGALLDMQSKKTAKPETGKNVDSSIIEAGTEATRDKMKINVPPPTVIQQNTGTSAGGPTITAPGGVANVRTDDPTWLRFQQKRAVA